MTAFNFNPFKGSRMSPKAFVPRYLRFGVLLALFLLLQACVSPSALVESTALPKTETGYVAGVFSANRVVSFGFDLVNTKTQENTVMPFFKRSYTPTVRPDQFTMISLPTGTYRIKRWVTLGTMNNGILTSKNFPHPETLQFDVTPGRITFLGKFFADMEFRPKGIYLQFEQLPVDQDQVARLINAAYPNFSVTLLDPFIADWRTGE